MHKLFLLKVLFCFLILLIIAYSSNPQMVLADGMLIDPDPYSDRWDYYDETSQLAFINYEDGFEKMIISIEFNQSDKNLYWVFPVPANPEKVSINILNTLPNFKGEDIKLRAQKELDDTKDFLRLTQIYPYLFNAFFGINTLDVGLDTKAPSFGATGRVDFSGGQKDVIVYEHLEKEGITTEIITAVTPLGLSNYFKDKGFKLDGKSIRALNHYIGRNFTFVVSWITNSSKATQTPRKVNQASQRGIFVSFPTDKIYYPLIPTSVYESKIIPTSIRVIGHVSPIIFDDIKGSTEIKYYIDNNFSYNPELEQFYKYDKSTLTYTLINLNSPSKMFTDDLWINKATSLKTYIPLFISLHPYLTTILLLIICSFIAGIITAWSISKENRNFPSFIKFGLIGLSNCLTLIALTITVFIKLNSKRILFIFLFSINFLITSWLVIKLIESSL